MEVHTTTTPIFDFSAGLMRMVAIVTVPAEDGFSFEARWEDNGELLTRSDRAGPTSSEALRAAHAAIAQAVQP
jgi:hypothetical protein